MADEAPQSPLPLGSTRIPLPPAQFPRRVQLYLARTTDGIVLGATSGKPGGIGGRGGDRTQLRFSLVFPHRSGSYTLQHTVRRRFLIGRNGSDALTKTATRWAGPAYTTGLILQRSMFTIVDNIVLQGKKNAKKKHPPEQVKKQCHHKKFG